MLIEIGRDLFYLISCKTNTLLLCTFEKGGKNICQNRSKPKKKFVSATKTYARNLILCYVKLSRKVSSIGSVKCQLICILK